MTKLILTPEEIDRAINLWQKKWGKKTPMVLAPDFQLQIHHPSRKKKIWRAR